jgi:3-phenylpropionate/trans-cinnamate dioxygenase ferredoxin reductase component
MTQNIVIVGKGQAASDVAAALRQQGHKGSIVLVGDEPVLPYRRPPLSKGYLAGDLTADDLYIRPQAAYDKLGIQLLTDQVTSIDRGAHVAYLQSGTEIEYDKLVFATGGRPRKLNVPGADKANLHYVRTLTDIDALREQFSAGKRLGIIGGGYIGLEVAAIAVKARLQVCVLEAMPRLLARVTGPEMSEYYAKVHRSHGVDVRVNAQVSLLIGDTAVREIALNDGSRIPVDVVVVGVGLIPNTEIAESAGLLVDDGIVVDKLGQTADPDIYALGDCANRFNDFLGRRIRLESVPSASEQSRIVASVICGGKVPESNVPWFWSDQYDLKLQMAGLSQGYDRILLRGSMDDDSFTAFYLQDEVIIAVDSVNQPKEFMLGKKMVAERARIDHDKLSDGSIPIQSLLG